MFFTNFWKNRLGVVVARHQHTEERLKAIEDYLSIEFFEGEKNKPHYRRRKVVVKKIGRPRKKAN